MERTLAAMTPNAGATPTEPAPAATPSATVPVQAETPPAPATAPPFATEPSAAPTTAGPARPNGAVLVATRRDTAPIVDGDQADWPAELPYAIDQIVHNPASHWQGPGDQVGRFNAMWDQTHLYLFVVIEDEAHVQNDAGVTLYRGDSLELQFDADLAGDFDSTELNTDDYQIGLSPGSTRENPETYFWNPFARRGEPSGITLATRSTGGSGGYVAEIAVPWSLFGITPSAGSRFGFALNSSDNDSPGTQEQQSMISSVITRRLLDPTTWGTIEISY